MRPFTPNQVFIQEPHGSDIASHRFGRWIVLQYAFSKQNKGRRRHYWFCQCDCGNYKTVLAETLTGSKSKSCGCLEREIVAKVKKGFCSLFPI